MEGQDAGVNTEQRVSAQNLHVAILEVENGVGSYGCGVDGRFVVGNVGDGEVG